MGFPTAEYVDQPVNEDMICSLCLDVLERPLNACPEGHTFCAECLTSAQVNNDACPQCRAALLPNPPLNRPLQNMVSKLLMHCKHWNTRERDGAPPSKQRRTSSTMSAALADTPASAQPAGCDWTGTREQLDGHLKSCAFAELKCPFFGCKARVFGAAALAAHREVCEWRQVSCQACKKQVPARRLKQHERRACLERAVDCPYCEEKMTARALGEQPDRLWYERRMGIPSYEDYLSTFTGHLAKCQHVEVCCEFLPLGCAQKFKRCEYAVHHAANASAHASLSVKKLREVEQKLFKTRDALREEADWHSMDLTVEIPCSRFAGTRRTVIKSAIGPLVHGYKMYIKMVIAEGVNGAVTVSLCVEDPSWTPVQVQEVSIRLDTSDSYYYEDPCWDPKEILNADRTQWIVPDEPIAGPFPSAARGEAELVGPAYSFGGPLRYIYFPNEDDDDDAEPREVTRACLNVTDGRYQMSRSVPGLSRSIKLTAQFEVKRSTSAEVGCRD